MTVLLRLKTDAALSADFDKLLKEMRAASHAIPRTAESVGLAKSVGLKLKKITDEMKRRSDLNLGYIGASDAVVNEVNAAAGVVGDVVVSYTNKIILGLGLIVAALFLKK